MKRISVLIPNYNEENVHHFMEEIHDCLKDDLLEIITCRDREGRGKGWAVREAYMHAKGDYIAFIDGDGDIPVRMLKRLIAFMEDFDAAVGSKRMSAAPLQRKIITHLSRIYLRLLFGVNCDTQTGVKLFRTEALCVWRTNGFLFDVEIIAEARKRGCRIVEVPIEAEIKSRVSMGVLWRTFLESLKLRYQL